jgi:hypothetical protein
MPAVVEYGQEGKQTRLAYVPPYSESASDSELKPNQKHDPTTGWPSSDILRMLNPATAIGQDYRKQEESSTTKNAVVSRKSPLRMAGSNERRFILRKTLCSPRRDEDMVGGGEDSHSPPRLEPDVRFVEQDGGHYRQGKHNGARHDSPPSHVQRDPNTETRSLKTVRFQESTLHQKRPVKPPRVHFDSVRSNISETPEEISDNSVSDLDSENERAARTRQAVKAALLAGAAEAFRLRNEPGGSARIIAAATAAAVNNRGEERLNKRYPPST